MRCTFRLFLSSLPLTALLTACPGEPEDDGMDAGSTTADGATTSPSTTTGEVSTTDNPSTTGEVSTTDNPSTGDAPGPTGDVCADHCQRERGCDADVDYGECLMQCENLREIREAYYEPHCLAATDARITCETSLSCDLDDASCDALAFAEHSTCIAGAQPPAAVADICRFSVDCAYEVDEGYAPEPCPEEYLDDPYYSFYCEVSLYDYCVFEFIEYYVVEARQHGCVEEFEAALTCSAQLECSGAGEDETPCTAEAEALEEACPDFGMYD